MPGLKRMMKTATYILLIITIVLGGVAAALMLWPADGTGNSDKDVRYGLHEGLRLVVQTDKDGRKTYAVEDGDGDNLFNIPLRNCMLDDRYRNGRLRFRENGTGREGYIDRQGIVVFAFNGKVPAAADEGQSTIITGRQTATGGVGTVHAQARTGMETEADLKTISRQNPFYKEAVKVLSGGLGEEDAHRRRVILGYCEHLRTAYTTKDIDFLRQVFSEKALIIVGNVVKTKSGGSNDYLPKDKVEYNIHSKKEYLDRINKVFATNKSVDVRFSDFKIMRHPTINGIYGVSLRQQYKSDRYSDDGYLFLLWDFRNESMPVIHVRTWQAAGAINDDNEVINIRDFNFE